MNIMKILGVNNASIYRQKNVFNLNNIERSTDERDCYPSNDTSTT